MPHNEQNPKQTKVLLSPFEHFNHIYLYSGRMLQGVLLKRGVVFQFLFPSKSTPTSESSKLVSIGGKAAS